MNNILDELIKSIDIKDCKLPIDAKSIIEEKFLVKNKLIVNSQKGNLLKELKESLSECISYYFSVAFINFSGLQLLLDSFKELDQRGVKGNIITSTYLNFTEPKALEKLRGFNNIDLKVFIAEREKGFHTKAYIFENKDNYKIIIGSSNITQSALKSNVEWNVMVISKKETEFVQEVLEEYKGLWDSTGYVDDEFLSKYKSFVTTIKKGESKNLVEFNDYKIIKPNIMQKDALENLNRLRSLGENKALVIAATGTGKTYMSAFDVLQFNPKKLLFIVHREDILRSAEKTYKSLTKNKNIETGFYTGNKKDIKSDYLFATVQTMERNLESFNSNEFDYIVIDEAHHSTSPTYQKILSYFKTKFLLGITATPERCDEGDIFDVFSNNVALEVRLHEALENDLIDKDSLKVSVATDFADIPGCSNIQMDRSAQERILQQLNTENFNNLKYLKEEYNEFKALLGGRIPYTLMEYIKYDGAPDPLKFIGYAKTYQGFLGKVEKNININELLLDEEFSKVIKEFSNKLPIKRPHEFAIIKYMVNHSEITAEQAEKEILKYIDTVDTNTIIHAFRTLNQDFYDSAQIKNNIKLFNYDSDKLVRLISFEKILMNKEFKLIIEDLINYGLVMYEKRFGNKNHGMPYLKLYEQYQMVDAALLSNYEKIHSSFRGSGLITNGNEYFLFVDLHKEEDIKESINYKDEFVNRKIFQWQSPNSTSQGSERGKNIIFNKDRGINLHLFVRKYKEIDGKVQSYIYLGKGDCIAYEGEKPITIKMELENKIPENLFVEFTKKV